MLRRALQCAAALCLAAVCLAAPAGCAGQEQGSVAATVSGRDILESAVTDYIATFRTGIQCTAPDEWARYLEDKGTTPQGVRETTIYELAAPVIIEKEAAGRGIEADGEEVEKQLEAMRASFLTQDDAAWKHELERLGTNEDELRKKYTVNNLKQQLLAEVSKDFEPTEKDVENYVADTLLGQRTKKIECVFASDESAMKAALAKVRKAASPEAGMAYVKAHAEELGVRFADVGWDLYAELTEGMKEVTDSLENGQAVKELLHEDDTYYLFYICDEYEFPFDVANHYWKDADLEEGVTDAARETLRSAYGSVWLDKQVRSATIVNEMPEGLPYDVDVPQGTASQESGQDGDGE